MKKAKLILITEKEFIVEDTTTKTEDMVLFHINSIEDLLYVKNNPMQIKGKNIYKVELTPETKEIKIISQIDRKFLLFTLMNNLKYKKNNIGFDMTHFINLKTYDRKGNYLFDYVASKKYILPFTVEEFKHILENRTDYFKINTENRYKKFDLVFNVIKEKEISDESYYVSKWYKRSVNVPKISIIPTKKVKSFRKNIESNRPIFEIKTLNDEMVTVPTGHINIIHNKIDVKIRDYAESVKYYNGFIQSTEMNKYLIVSIPENKKDLFNITSEEVKTYIEVTEDCKDITLSKYFITFIPTFNSLLMLKTVSHMCRYMKLLMEVLYKYDNDTKDTIGSIKCKVYTKGFYKCTESDIKFMSVNELLDNEDELKSVHTLIIPAFEHVIELTNIDMNDYNTIKICTDNLGIKMDKKFFKEVNAKVIR